MTAIALIPIIATILRIDAGLAYLDQGLLAGLRVGDVGAIYYEMPVGGEMQRIQVSRGVVIDLDELGATLEVEPEFQVLPGYSVEFEIPHERVKPTALLDLARSRLRVRREDGAGIQPLLERMIPDDRLVEEQILRLIESRRQRRGEAPAALATATPAPLDPAPAALADRVLDWAQAWSDQRVDDYLGFYSARFQPPNGMSRAAWEASRRKRIAGPRLINVALSEIETRIFDPRRAQAMFFQDYRSTRYQDRVFKQLTMEHEEGEWKIVREEVVDVDQPFALEPPVETIAAVEVETGGETLTGVIEAWAEAWSSQRVDDYLAFYAEDFQPSNGMSREAWEAHRREHVAAPRAVAVTLRDLETEIVDEHHAQARFVQAYEANHYRDVVQKRLDLVAVDGGWKIARETVLE